MVGLEHYLTVAVRTPNILAFLSDRGAVCRAVPMKTRQRAARIPSVLFGHLCKRLA